MLTTIHYIGQNAATSNICDIAIKITATSIDNNTSDNNCSYKSNSNNCQHITTKAQQLETWVLNRLWWCHTAAHRVHPKTHLCVQVAFNATTNNKECNKKQAENQRLKYATTSATSSFTLQLVRQKIVACNVASGQPRSFGP